MHQIRFRLGPRPESRWGSLQRSPDPSWIYRVYFEMYGGQGRAWPGLRTRRRGKEEVGEWREGEEGERRGEEKRGGTSAF